MAWRSCAVTTVRTISPISISVRTTINRAFTAFMTIPVFIFPITDSAKDLLKCATAGIFGFDCLEFGCTGKTWSNLFPSIVCSNWWVYMLNIRPEVIDSPPLLPFRVFILIRPFRLLFLKLLNRSIIKLLTSYDVLNIPVRISALLYRHQC